MEAVHVSSLKSVTDNIETVTDKTDISSIPYFAVVIINVSHLICYVIYFIAEIIVIGENIGDLWSLNSQIISESIYGTFIVLYSLYFFIIPNDNGFIFTLSILNGINYYFTLWRLLYFCNMKIVVVAVLCGLSMFTQSIFMIFIICRYHEFKKARTKTVFQYFHRTNVSMAK